MLCCASCVLRTRRHTRPNRAETETKLKQIEIGLLLEFIHLKPQTIHHNRHHVAHRLAFWCLTKLHRCSCRPKSRAHQLQVSSVGLPATVEYVVHEHSQQCIECLFGQHWGTCGPGVASGQRGVRTATVAIWLWWHRWSSVSRSVNYQQELGCVGVRNGQAKGHSVMKQTMLCANDTRQTANNAPPQALDQASVVAVVPAVQGLSGGRSCCSSHDHCHRQAGGCACLPSA